MTYSVQMVATLLSAPKAAGLGRAADAAYGAALRVPTPVLTAGLGAAASVPLTAMFGSRDEQGRKRYVRNAGLAAVIGALAPSVYRPQWLRNHEQNVGYRNVLRAYEGEKRDRLTALQGGVAKYVDNPRASDAVAGWSRTSGAITEPRLDVLNMYGTPASRWRTLFSGAQYPAAVAQHYLPFDANLMSRLPSQVGVPAVDYPVAEAQDRLQAQVAATVPDPTFGRPELAGN